MQPSASTQAERLETEVVRAPGLLADGPDGIQQEYSEEEEEVVYYDEEDEEDEA